MSDFITEPKDKYILWDSDELCRLNGHSIMSNATTTRNGQCVNCGRWVTYL